MSPLPEKVVKFLDFIKGVESHAIGPTYSHPDSSRFPDCTTTFDAMIRLPSDKKPRKRTVVIYTCVADASWYKSVLEKVNHPCILKPAYTDRRVKVENSRRASHTVMVAHIYTLFPKRFDVWVKMDLRRFWLWDSEDHRRILGVSPLFRRFYSNLAFLYKLLHKAGTYHGNDITGIFVTDNFEVKLANFKKIRVDVKEDVDNGIIHDLKTIKCVMESIICSGRLAELQYPFSVRLYFHLFELFQPFVKPEHLRLLRETIYLPPLMFDSTQRGKAIDKAWTFENFIRDQNPIRIFASVKNPETGAELFDKNWREGISRLGDIDSPLRVAVVTNLLKVENEKYLRERYVYGFGIIDLHRHCLTHHDDLFGKNSRRYEAAYLLFYLWPDAIPTICYGLLCLVLGQNMTEEHRLPRSLDLLQLMKDNSLVLKLDSKRSAVLAEDEDGGT